MPVAESKSVLDPVWEYILDDYDQKPQRRVKPRPRRKRREQQKSIVDEPEAPGYFESWFLDEDDHRDEKAHQSEQSNAECLQTESRDDSRSAMSSRSKSKDMIAVPEPQVDERPQKKSWRTKKPMSRTKLSRNKQLSLSTAQLAPSDRSQQRSPLPELTSSSREEYHSGSSTSKRSSGKKGILKHFKRSSMKKGAAIEQPQQSFIEPEPPSRSSQPAPTFNRGAHEEIRADPDIQVPNPREQGRDSKTPLYIDPFSTLFNAPGVFNPWSASDSEAEDTISAFSGTDNTETSAEHSDCQSTSSHSTSTFTEIRLQYTPTRLASDDEDDGEDNDDYTGNRSASEIRASIVSQAVSERLLGQVESREPISLSRSRGYAGERALFELGQNKSETFDDEPFSPYDDPHNLERELRSEMKDQQTPSSAERGNEKPATSNQKESQRSLSEVKGRPSLVTSFLGNGDRKQKGKHVLKKLACWSQKHSETNLLSDTNGEDTATIFPKSRVVSDEPNEQASLIATGHNKTDGGVPTSQILQTQGPQSVYDYGYDSGEHMAAVYTKFNVMPKTDITTWQFSAAPAALTEEQNSMVVVQVEASTVSETDCIIRRGDWWGQQDLNLPNSPGVDFVGKIFDITPDVASAYQLKKSQTVISLTTYGGNSRFMKIHPSNLVKVPQGIDPAEAACLPETFLTAFQVLHFGQMGSLRYKEKSLKGKLVLIVGAMSNNLGKAIIDLAMHANAAAVYATAKRKHWRALAALGVIPLDPDVTSWIVRLEGSIDLLLATNAGTREDVSALHLRALRPKMGHLIMSGQRLGGNDIPVGEWKHKTTISCAKNKSTAKLLSHTHNYDIFDHWDRKPELCKADLEHLLQLLGKGKIKPHILDRITLAKVGKAHEVIDSKRLTGFLVCEPWLLGKKRALHL